MTIEKIIPGRNITEYLQLKREGWVVKWVGEGRICFVKEQPKRSKL